MLEALRVESEERGGVVKRGGVANCGAVGVADSHLGELDVAEVQYGLGVG